MDSSGNVALSWMKHRDSLSSLCYKYVSNHPKVVPYVFGRHVVCPKPTNTYSADISISMIEHDEYRVYFARAWIDL